MVTPENPAFFYFASKCKEVYLEHLKRNAPNLVDKPDEWRVDDLKRYIRIVHGGSAYCFIEKTNGDVLKPAGFKSPAKHARGNIFDEHNGLKYIGPYGSAYLR